MRRAVVTFTCVLFLCAGVALATTGGGSSRPAPEVAARAIIPTTTTLDPVAANRLTEYLTAIARQQVADYIAAVERDELAAFVASIPPPPVEAPRGSSEPPPYNRATGGHSDAWWMGVAQCEQGGRNDSYFGYFSFMDGSQGGRPWADQVAAGNALLAGQASESPAWAPACVAAGYAASPSG